MARLNEPPAPTETVESVKRRFLRQNRDLAKCNSNQSVRIRNLELETSRLLAENLALREEILQLQAQLENYHHRPPSESVGAIKIGLEAKVQELATLVAELNLLETSPPPRCKPQALATKKSPGERNWKNPLLIPDAMGGEVLLPTISEDKFFPRRTLEANDISAMFSNPVNDSPDLGPPPVAHFQDEDPIKFDPNSSSSPEELKEESAPSDAIPAALAINLETRRKRRDSQRLEIRRTLTKEVTPDNTDPEGGLSCESKERPRAGAKRKLSVRDDDESTSKPRPNEFKLTRKAINISETIANSTVRVTADTVPKRKILGAKSANSDMSPKKPALQKGTLSEKPNLTDKLSLDDIKSRKVKAKASEPRLEVVRPVQQDDAIETIAISLETASIAPKTPAIPQNLLSPLSTEPSAARPETRDTPPPADLGRPSRRARAAVNYAEPNLISKMRRPTAEMVDAVRIDGHRSSSSSLIPKKDDTGSAPLTVERPTTRTVVIKTEREDEGASWKDIPDDKQDPASPLSKKTIEATRQDEKRDELGKLGDTKLSGSGATISALMAGGSKIRRRPSSRLNQDADIDGLSGSLNNMAIYDFTESSPTGASTEGEELGRSKIDTAPARQGRRHSSASGLSISRTNPSSGISIARHRTAAEIKAARTTLSSAIASASADAQQADDASKTSTLGPKTERMASRRRSMML